MNSPHPPNSSSGRKARFTQRTLPGQKALPGLESAEDKKERKGKLKYRWKDERYWTQISPPTCR